MKLSVVVPAYNQGPFVGETLESLLTQTRPADEILVSDNHSTDETPRVLEAYRDRIRVVRPKDPNDIKDRTGLSSGGVTKVVDRLAERGMVSRAYGVIPEDHRGVLVSLTDEGRGFVAAVTKALAEHLPHSRALITELDRLLPG